MATSKLMRIAIGLCSIILVGLVYVFQQADFLFLITRHVFGDTAHFIVNRTVRIALNDFALLMLIFALFPERNIIRLALVVQLLDIFVLFPLYLVLKIPQEGTSEISSPFLSQFHRLIVNPTLMILLIPAILYQKTVGLKEH